LTSKTNPDLDSRTIKRDQEERITSRTAKTKSNPNNFIQRENEIKSKQFLEQSLSLSPESENEIKSSNFIEIKSKMKSNPRLSDKNKIEVSQNEIENVRRHERPSPETERPSCDRG